MLPAMNALAERPDVLGGQGAGGTRRRRQVIDGALQIGLPVACARIVVHRFAFDVAFQRHVGGAAPVAAQLYSRM